ncbi:hypothetical protein NF865_05265 [Thermococcus aggregans]|uniref:Uncharacterized protein n=1 Tax=Thermococcus aggregans TaxID=110163 RepID=A0A9E7MZ63_THEAG|nr:hypothetical protein [Thermococcus aggregans]USS41568.1 hypothetical protein NF865_05265 [Thermococcus aggregans]
MGTSVAVNRIRLGQRALHPTDMPLGIINNTYIHKHHKLYVVVKRAFLHAVNGKASAHNDGENL